MAESEKQTINIRPNYESMYKMLIDSIRVKLSQPHKELSSEDIESIARELDVIDEIARPAVTNMERRLQEQEQEENSDERKRFLFDVFLTAIETGIGYWATIRTYYWRTEDGVEDHEKFYARISEQEDDTSTFDVDAYTIGIGIKHVLGKDFKVNPAIRAAIEEANHRNDAGMIDAIAADVIVQAALFGQIVYG